MQILSRNYLQRAMAAQELVSWGASGATGHPSDTSVPTALEPPTSIIKDIACGGTFSVLLYTSGVCEWPGRGTHPGVLAVGCGWTHAVLVKSSGIYSWDGTTLVLLHADPGPVVSVSGAWKTSMALLVSGAVLPAAPVGPVSQLAVGWKHSVLLVDGRVYIHCRKSTHGLVTGWVPGLEDIVQVSSGWSHVAARDSGGRVYCWGRNDLGQCGLGHAHPSIAVPQRVELLPPSTRIACGSEHTLAVVRDRQVYMWGWNEHGNLGTGDCIDRQVPTLVEYSFGEITHIGTAGAAVVLVTSTT